MMTNDYYVRKIDESEVFHVIEEIGFDKSYLNKAISKYKFSLLKIHNVTCPQASIIKQLALSIGADAAVHRSVLIHKIEKSDLLLGCTHSQLKLLCAKLKNQPFGLSKLSDILLAQIENTALTPLTINNRVFDWSKKTYIMGILNVTPDSFSDGGKYFSLSDAENQIINMIENNIDIIDVGGETTKPFSLEVAAKEQLERILPVIAKIREIDKNVPVSVDTRSAIVARKAIESGANIINDVSGFDWDENMMKTALELDVPAIITHSLSSPTDMQINPTYKENIIDSIYKSLSDKVEKAKSIGIKKHNLILDPGIGFGKTQEHNIEIIKRINEFCSLGYPLLVGVSRKSVIANILNLPSSDREEATIALNSYMASNGANIIRVHDVEKNNKAFKVLDYILNRI